MDNLIRKTIVLCLIDSDPKSANEIADAIDESLADMKNQLTAFVSEGICEIVRHNEVSQYILKKDIENFVQLVKEFLSNTENHKEEIKQFITSEYYWTRIDDELVDYVLSRFYLNSVYQNDKAKKGIERILLASPSALLFALHGDTTIFSELYSNWDHLDTSDETREWFTHILRSHFMTPLLEKLIADMKVPTYGFLYNKLQLMVAKIGIQVSLATTHERYVEAVAGGDFSLFQAGEDLRAGQLISPVNPVILSNYGLAFLHLGEFSTALDNFDKAFSAAQDPIQKAHILNCKGVTFLRLKQYHKAIECFEEGIKFDSEGKRTELRENKQTAEEYLVYATDTDNLTDPTRFRFVQGQPVPFEETRSYEFKEIRGGNPTRSIVDTSDIYTVSLLNYEKGGRIFWGIRDKDRITTGVILNEQQRDNVRAKVTEKLGNIQPSIVGHWQLELHPVYDLQREVVEDLWVIELLIPPLEEKEVFYTGKGELHVKTEGGKKKLLGPDITEFISRRLKGET